MRIHSRDKNIEFAMDTSRMDRGLHIAQVHLDNRVLMDSSAFAPEKQGDLVGSGITHTVLGSGLVIWDTPYAHYQYEGRVMVGKRSRSAWAKKHEPKVYTQNRLEYKKKEARAKWFEVAKQRYLEKWQKGVQEDLHG